MTSQLDTDKAELARLVATTFPTEPPARPWYRGPMVAFDTETTGVDPETARIVSAAIVPVQCATWNTPREWLLDPEVPIEPSATAVHGLTDEYVREHGDDPVLYIPEIVTEIRKAWARGWPVVIYNAAFDLTVLDREMRRHHGPGLSIDGLVIDPFVLDKLTDPFRRGSRKLAAVAAHYGVPDLDPADLHRASTDALAAARVAWKIANRYPAQLGYAEAEHLMRLQTVGRRVDMADLRDYFARQGRTEDAASVREDWPVWGVA